MLLQTYLDSMENSPQMNLHKDMVAKYLECGSGNKLDSPSLHGCLQKLSCLIYDSSVNLTEMEHQVGNM